MNKIKFFFVLFLLLPVISFGQELKTGDLLFVLEGGSEFSEAISDATSFSDSLSFVHVGILESDSEKGNIVIEASPEEGVRSISLDEFLNLAPKIQGQPGVVVKRVNVDYPVETTIINAKSYEGQPYDWWYLPDNGKMYCSELVYESYRDTKGDRLFTSKPMNFRTSDGSMPDFWIKLFEELGEPIPEGFPGTNPNDMSQDPILIEVYKFF